MDENKQQEIDVNEEISAEENALVKENEELKAELEKAKKEASEFKDKWMRNVAEFDNYKKRNAKLWAEASADGKSSVILKILPVGDHLDMALSLGLDEKSLKGIELIKKKFMAITLKVIDTILEINLDILKLLLILL